MFGTSEAQQVMLRNIEAPVPIITIVNKAQNSLAYAFDTLIDLTTLPHKPQDTLIIKINGYVNIYFVPEAKDTLVFFCEIKINLIKKVVIKNRSNLFQINSKKEYKKRMSANGVRRGGEIRMGFYHPANAQLTNLQFKTYSGSKHNDSMYFKLKIYKSKTN